MHRKLYVSKLRTLLRPSALSPAICAGITRTRNSLAECAEMQERPGFVLHGKLVVRDVHVALSFVLSEVANRLHGSNSRMASCSPLERPKVMNNPSVCGL